MSLTILSGSPKSGKTRQAYLLAAKVAETGKVLIFTDDGIPTIKANCTVFTKSEYNNVHFNRLFSLSELEIQVEEFCPQLVIIDTRLGDEVTADQLDKYGTQILLVRNTLAVLSS
jgi:tRNA uridine 5-carbamoylmethylation protein Kti12